MKAKNAGIVSKHNYFGMMFSSFSVKSFILIILEFLENEYNVCH